MKDFIFFNLQELVGGKPFPGFAVGEFVDMLGREIEFPDDDFEDYLSNTLALIEAAKEKGQPGLPIDARRHERGDAAGWLTGAEAGEVADSKGNVRPAILFYPEWTPLGEKLISNKEQTNFSPTVDRDNKRVAGGSLTNWPASVDEDGVPLFTAIELSQGLHALQQAETEPDDETVYKPADDPAENLEGETDMGQEKDKAPAKEPTAEKPDLAELRQQIRDELLAELAPGDADNPEDAMARLRESLNLEAFADVADLSQARDSLLSEMQKALKAEYDRMQAQAGTMLRDMMTQMKRDQHIAELSQKWTGGTEQNPHGLPVGREEVETFLMGLNDKQRQAAESIFGRVWEHGLTEFTELGHGKEVQGTAQLEPAIARQLEQHLEGGGNIAEFFDAASDILGDRKRYDLSQFEEK